MTNQVMKCENGEIQASFNVHGYVETRIQKLMKEHEEVVKEQYYLHKN